MEKFDQASALKGQSFNREYSVNAHQYPTDLSNGEEYGKHRVIFYINVNGGGVTASATDEEGVSLTMDMPPSRFKQFSGEKLKAEAAKTAGGEQVQKFIKVTKPARRLKTAISLYLPESLIKSYGVSWEEEEVSQVADLAAQAALAASTQDGGVGAAATTAVKGAAALGVSSLINNMKYAQKSLGVTPGNSKAEVLFQSVSFGQFTFDYKFAPKNKREAANVLNIIRTFRHHMLPEYLDETNFLFIYPSEFDIRYYINNKENDYLERHMTSVLTNMTVNYNPNGQFTTFDDGMPTHINMTLQFKELSIPNKATSPYDSSGA